MIYKGAKAEGDCVIFSNNSFLKYSDREYGMIKIYSLQIDEQFPSEECIPKNTALKQKKDGFEGLRFKGHKKIQSNFKVNVYVSLFKKIYTSSAYPGVSLFLTHSIRVICTHSMSKHNLSSFIYKCNS